MAGQTDTAVLRSSGRLGCGGDECSATFSGEQGSRETECSGRYGSSGVRCKGSRETSVPVPQAEANGVACDSPIDRLATLCRYDSPIKEYANGAKRSDIGDYRYDLIPGLHAVALAMGQGAKKFGENNWRGLEPSVCVNHALRHLLLLLDGDTSEDHAGHAACNCLMLVELLQKKD